MEVEAKASGLAALLDEIHASISSGQSFEAMAGVEKLAADWPALHPLALELRELCPKAGGATAGEASYNGFDTAEGTLARELLEQFKPLKRRFGSLSRLTACREVPAEPIGVEERDPLASTVEPFGLDDLDSWLSTKTISTSPVILSDNLEVRVDAVSYCEKLSVVSIEGWWFGGREAMNSLTIITAGKHATVLPSLIKSRPRPDLKAHCLEKGLPEEQIQSAGFSLAVPMTDLCQRCDSLRFCGVLLIWSLEDRTGHTRFHVQELGARLKPMGASRAAHAAIDCLINDDLQILSARGLGVLSQAWSERCLKQLAIPVKHQRFNSQATRPTVSIIIPVYGREEFIEYQLAAFHYLSRRNYSRDSFPYQIIFVLDDPRLERTVERLAIRCESLYTVPFEIVYNQENLGFAAANNQGANYALAPFALLMNSDVIPATDHSIDRMLSSLKQNLGKVGAIGAKLVYENGAIQHVGMEFVMQSWHQGILAQVWLNDHPWKGIRRGLSLQDCRFLLDVEAASAACLMMPTSLFNSLRGFDTRYIVGDFEDSDLCLSIRAEGLSIAVDLEAEFYHLERQSLGSGIPKGLAAQKLVATNAYLHHVKQSSIIQGLKQDQHAA